MRDDNLFDTMTKQIEVTRVFHAPIEMVWQVWTNPELIKRWWGPKHFTAPTAKIDFREGGKSIVSMKAPPEMGGREWYSLWKYVRITEHTTIEFIQSLCDSEGKETDPEAVGMPADFPRNIRTIVSFKVISADTTEMTVTEFAEFGSISNFAQIGLAQSMDKIGEVFTDKLR